MTTILIGVAMVFVIEGLVLALAPSRLDDIMRMLAEIPPETRRLMGLGTLAAGVVLIWLARGLGA